MRVPICTPSAPSANAAAIVAPVDDPAGGDDRHVDLRARPAAAAPSSPRRVGFLNPPPSPPSTTSPSTPASTALSAAASVGTTWNTVSPASLSSLVYLVGSPADVVTNLTPCSTTKSTMCGSRTNAWAMFTPNGLSVRSRIFADLVLDRVELARRGLDDAARRRRSTRPRPAGCGRSSPSAPGRSGCRRRGRARRGCRRPDGRSVIGPSWPVSRPRAGSRMRPMATDAWHSAAAARTFSVGSVSVVVSTFVAELRRQPLEVGVADPQQAGARRPALGRVAARGARHQLGHLLHVPAGLRGVGLQHRLVLRAPAGDGRRDRRRRAAGCRGGAAAPWSPAPPAGGTGRASTGSSSSRPRPCQ